MGRRASQTTAEGQQVAIRYLGRGDVARRRRWRRWWAEDDETA